MDKKRKILRIAIFVFMALSLSMTTSQTLAYWAEPTDANDTATATVIVGEWSQAFQWDPNITYAVGDLVINNGITYEAKKDAPTREPGVDRGWNADWIQL